jgi:hypothetical protein
MAWSVQGRSIEHCNCNSICPCYSSGLVRPGDYERCVGYIAFEIERGEADGVDLSGRNVVFLQDAPGVMVEGNWKAGLVIDDGASPEQTDKLAAIFSGQAGGPLAAFGPLVAEFLGVERAPIQVSHAGGVHTLRAGQLIDSEFADEVHPGASGPVQMLNTAALPFIDPITISPPTRSVIKAFGWNVDNAGRHGTTSTFNWSA